MGQPRDNSDYADVIKQLRKSIPTHHQPYGALQGAFERNRALKELTSN